MHTTKRGEFLAIDTIHESTTNPRRTFDEAKLYELAESIKHNGLIQPITVRPNNQGFEVVAGARRYRAAQLAELFSVGTPLELSATFRGTREEVALRFVIADKDSLAPGDQMGIRRYLLEQVTLSNSARYLSPARVTRG